MNTPEQIAAKWYPEGTIDHAVMRKRLAALIRRARNTALREAELAVRYELCGPSWDNLADRACRRIRSLKSKALRGKDNP